MKICLAGNYTRPDTLGSSILKVQQQLFKYLNKQNIQTIFFESSNKKNIYNKLFDKLIYLKLKEGTLVQGGVINFIFYLRKNDYEIIHFIDDRYYMVLICLCSFILKAKMITTFHNTLNFRDYKSELLPHVRRLILKKFSDIILVFSNEDQKLLKKLYNNKRIMTVRNGVDTLFHFPLRKENSAKLILFCGGVSHSYKGLNFLESSLCAVNESYHLVICGKNGNNTKNKLYIGELTPNKMKELFQRARIIVVPSQYDAFSLTVLEAMSCGIPTILTKQCGVSNHLEDGAGCFIVNYGDTKELAHRISILLSDTKLWVKMSKKALEISKLFDWGKVLRDYERIYQSLLSNEEL